jgi:hypothetical protein
MQPTVSRLHVLQIGLSLGAKELAELLHAIYKKKIE